MQLLAGIVAIFSKERSGTGSFQFWWSVQDLGLKGLFSPWKTAFDEGVLVKLIGKRQLFNCIYIIQWDLDVREHSPEKLIDTTERQRHTRRQGQKRKSVPVLALYQLIKITTGSHTFVKGNWNEKYTISAELEQKWSKVIDSECRE